MRTTINQDIQFIVTVALSLVVTMATAYYSTKPELSIAVKLIRSDLFLHNQRSVCSLALFMQLSAKVCAPPKTGPSLLCRVTEHTRPE